MSQRQSGHSFIRPEIRNLPGMRVFKADPDLHRLQWNENPYDFPADLKEEVMQRVARVEWSRYPLGIRAYDVIDAIANSAGLSSEQVVVGNGSSEMLRVVITAVLQPGDHMLTLAPTFGSYTNHARQLGAEVHAIPLDPAQSFALPVDTILTEAAQHDVKLIVICAPNNPTGTPYAEVDLRRIVLESNAFVLIDAAYAEFSGQDLRTLLTEADNVALVHTFSKAYALAGIRVGYTYSAPEVAQEFQKLASTFTLSPFSATAALVALENKDRFQPLIDSVVSERERLAAELARLPEVIVYPSITNFLFMYLGHSGRDAQAYLRTHQGVQISDMGMYPGYEEYLRISVGTPAQNDLVAMGLAHYLATVSA